MNSVIEPVAASTVADDTVTLSAVRDFAALEAHAAEWNALVERAVTRTIFQTWELNAAWLRALGAECELVVILARCAGRLVGIAPLVVRRQRVLGIQQRVVEFVGARSLDYTDFIVEAGRPDIVPLLIAELERLVPDYGLLHLRDIPAASGTAEALRAHFSGRRPVDIRELYKAPTRLFNDPAADKQLPNKKSLKRHYNHFNKAGRLELRHFRRADETLPWLDAFFEQHVGRRARTDTPSLFLDERNRAFYRAMVARLGPTGRLLFSVVLFDDTPIAMHFGFEYDGCLTWYKPAFDMEHAKHSPGEVLIRYLLEYALERKVRELDFTIGEEAFKYRFANHLRANVAVRVYRSRALHVLGRLLLAARRRIERHPRANRIARRLMAGWRGGAWT